MPIYEYVCDGCEHQFETIQKINEDPLKTCPECAEETLRKKISAAAFRLKGGGWYETDFKSGNQRNVVTDDKKSSEASSDSPKSDQKSDKKSDKTVDKSSDKKSAGSSSDSSSKGASSSSESKPSKSAT